MATLGQWFLNQMLKGNDGAQTIKTGVSESGDGNANASGGDQRAADSITVTRTHSHRRVAAPVKLPCRCNGKR